MANVLPLAAADRRFGPWLFGYRTDLVVFFGSALAALLISAVAEWAGVAAVSDVAWLVLVLGIDVAHVHATWFRTYLDPVELKRHPLRYAAIPGLAYIGGLCAYSFGPSSFWRGLAYLAVFHFVRQQVGWAALYRARAGLSADALERWVDDAAVYAATCFPLLVWHARLESKQFSWLSPGDFVALDVERFLPIATLLWASALALFFAREARRLWLRKQVVVGRVLLVSGTALTWYVGIVVNESDFVFTATNVIPHGVPYIWFLFAYARKRTQQDQAPSPVRWVARGLTFFVSALLVFAFLEEWAWDRLVDHERPGIFGFGPAWGLTQEATAAWSWWLVPLLALPQLTHYLLDGLLWRRGDRTEKPAIGRALGFDEGIPVTLHAQTAQVGGVHS